MQNPCYEATVTTNKMEGVHQPHTDTYTYPSRPDPDFVVPAYGKDIGVPPERMDHQSSGWLQRSLAPPASHPSGMKRLKLCGKTKTFMRLNCPNAIILRTMKSTGQYCVKNGISKSTFLKLIIVRKITFHEKVQICILHSVSCFYFHLLCSFFF